MLITRGATAAYAQRLTKVDTVKVMHLGFDRINTIQIVLYNPLEPVSYSYSCPLSGCSSVAVCSLSFDIYKKKYSRECSLENGRGFPPVSGDGDKSASNPRRMTLLLNASSHVMGVDYVTLDSLNDAGFFAPDTMILSTCKEAYVRGRYCTFRFF